MASLRSGKLHGISAKKKQLLFLKSNIEAAAKVDFQSASDLEIKTYNFAMTKALYAAGCRFAIYPALLFVVPLVLLVIAKSIIHKTPKLAWAFIEIWILAAVAVTAFATAVVTWVSLDTPINQIFNTSGLSVDQTKGISGVFVGAVSTYVALVWTKDIGDAQGAFWPSTQFKDAMDKAFHRLQPPPGNTTPAYQAIYQNTVEGYGNIGWGFRARLARANVLAAYISQPSH